MVPWMSCSQRTLVLIQSTPLTDHIRAASTTSGTTSGKGSIALGLQQQSQDECWTDLQDYICCWNHVHAGILSLLTCLCAGEEAYLRLRANRINRGYHLICCLPFNSMNSSKPPVFRELPYYITTKRIPSLGLCFSLFSPLPSHSLSPVLDFLFLSCL